MPPRHVQKRAPELQRLLVAREAMPRVCGVAADVVSPGQVAHPRPLLRYSQFHRWRRRTSGRDRNARSVQSSLGRPSPAARSSGASLRIAAEGEPHDLASLWPFFLARRTRRAACALLFAGLLTLRMLNVSLSRTRLTSRAIAAARMVFFARATPLRCLRALS